MRNAVLYGTIFLTKLGDSATTWFSLSNGGQEANPLVAFLISVNPILFYIGMPFIYASVLILFGVIIDHICRESDLNFSSRPILLMSIAFMSLVVANNIIVILSS